MAWMKAGRKFDGALDLSCGNKVFVKHLKR